MKLSHPVLKTMAFAIALSTACLADASPYAFADIAFTNLTLTVLPAAALTVTANDVTTSSSATYGIGSGMSLSQPGSFASGSDVGQSFMGPGPAVGENDFTQRLNGSVYGTRGDAIISANAPTGAQLLNLTVNDVSEGHLFATPTATSGASTGGTSTGFSFNFTTGAATSLFLNFTAQEMLQVSGTTLGDAPSAQASAGFTIRNLDTGAVQKYSPDELQNVLSLSTPSTQTYNSGSLTFSRQFDLVGGNYQFSFLTGTEERLQARIPEPGSVALLGVGILGFAGARRKKKNAQQA